MFKQKTGEQSNRGAEENIHPLSPAPLRRIISLSAALVSLLLAWRSERRYGQMARLNVAPSNGAPLDGATTAASLPSLSIIVPARNEAGNLPTLLASLTAVHYPGPLEIIVVDDNSADGTAVTAAAYGVHVLPLTELPEGWLGKPYACHRGAAVARGEWLLFTDADTVHQRRGVAAAVTYALQHELVGLSAFLRQQVNGWWDGAAILAAFVGLFAGLNSLAGLMNGQYILLRRDVYEGSGGFAAVRGETLEDLALGHRLHHLGYAIPILRGETAASVRMYDNFPQMWRGLTRLGAGALPWSGRGWLLTALFTTVAALPILWTTFVFSWRRLESQSLISSNLLTYAITAIGFLPAARRLGQPHWALWGPVGALLVQMAGTWGLLHRLLGRGVIWKGRLV